MTRRKGRTRAWYAYGEPRRGAKKPIVQVALFLRYNAGTIRLQLDPDEADVCARDLRKAAHEARQDPRPFSLDDAPADLLDPDVRQALIDARSAINVLEAQIDLHDGEQPEDEDGHVVALAIRQLGKLLDPPSEKDTTT